MILPEDEKIVGIIDLLGFVDIVTAWEFGSKTLENYVEEFKVKVHDWFYTYDLLNLAREKYGLTVPPSLEIRDVFEIKQISDTFFLFPKNSDPHSLTLLVILMDAVINNCLSLGYPLRGAITKGGYGKIHDNFIGPAIVRVHQLEQDQKWAGGVLDVGKFTDEVSLKIISELTAKGCLINNYPIPLKGAVEGPFLALGWPWFNQTSWEHSIQNWIHCAYWEFTQFSPQHDSSKIKEKKKATFAFQEFWFASHKKK